MCTETAGGVKDITCELLFVGMGESSQLEEPEQPHSTGECGQGGSSAFSCSASPPPAPFLPASPPLQGDEPLALWECLHVQEQWEEKGLLQYRWDSKYYHQ